MLVSLSMESQTTKGVTQYALLKPETRDMLRPGPPNLMTAEEFMDQKFDFPEGGRWTELHAGVVTTFEPPDDRHGNVIRNLSRLLAEFAQTQNRGYACFELGFILKRNPDTVFAPPISYITAGERFAETDSLVGSHKPVLVVEIASTNDRRRGMAGRVQAYLDWGIPTLWVADTVERKVHVFNPGRGSRSYGNDQILLGDQEMEAFQTPVEPLFADPEWWTSATKPTSQN